MLTETECLPRHRGCETRKLHRARASAVKALARPATTIAARKRPDLGVGLATVGLLEAGSNLAGGSLIDRLGDLVVASTPLPLVEETIKHLGITDKPFLRATLALQVASAIGLAIPGRRSSPAQALLAAVGLAAAAAGRARLDALERSRRGGLELPAADEPLGEVTDGGEGWPGAEPLFTDPGRFYQTDINLRPPAIDAAGWALGIELPGGSVRLTADDLLGLKLRERDALLVCVHNRPGWDRLGQQRWTGVPIADVLTSAGTLPENAADHDLIMEAVDGYRQVLPLDLALEGRSWVVVGMDGLPLPRQHGFPARVMTPGIVGQYNGVKWLTGLQVAPRGTQRSWWEGRRSWLGEPGWPRGPVRVLPMARIDSPANPGMPPRLPPPPIRVAAGPLTVVGTAWAPPRGVAAAELRVDGGEWRQCALAREINGDSWRRWRAEVELCRGEHSLEARCHGADGSIQAGAPADPFPRGAGAYHRVCLSVGAAGR